MMRKISTKFPWVHNQPGRQMHVRYVKLRFSTGREVSGSDAFPTKICVHPPRGGKRPRRCGDINHIGGGRRLLIAVMVQLTSTTLIVVEFSWSYLRLTSALQCVYVTEADMRSVCVICTTVGHHFNWGRASRDSRASCSTQICLEIYSYITVNYRVVFHWQPNSDWLAVMSCNEPVDENRKTINLTLVNQTQTVNHN